MFMQISAYALKLNQHVNFRYYDKLHCDKVYLSTINYITIELELVLQINIDCFAKTV